MATVGVLGGGISGLSAAYYLSKTATSGIGKIVLLESSSRLGGWVSSLQLEDGSLFEIGPRSIRGVGRSGYNTLELAEEIGLTNQIIPVPHTSPAARNRFIYVNGELCALPNNLKSVLLRRPPFTSPLFLAGLKEPFRSRSKDDDETVDSFFQRRFGNEIAKFAADPLCRGIFAGNSKKLSMRSCFPIFYDFERKYGSIVLASLLKPKDKTIPKSNLIDRFRSEKWSMWSLQKGLQMLPETLGHRLKNAEICLNTPCVGLEIARNGAKVKTAAGAKDFAHIICSLPAHEVSQLVSAEHPELSALLSSIEFASVAVVNLQFRSNILIVEGFGHLIPSHQLAPVLGVLYESCSFPQHNGPDNSTRLTVMMGGAWFRDAFGDVDHCDKEKIGRLAVSTVSDHLKISERPYRIITHVHKKCIPQYQVGHWKTVKQIENYIEKNQLPLTLIGSSYKGVSVNDCIYNARLAVQNFCVK